MVKLYQLAVLYIITSISMIQISSISICFRHFKKHLRTQGNQILQQTDKDNSFASRINSLNEFRSYKPHYLHSYSYATPVTPHFFFGKIQEKHPIFLYKQRSKRNEMKASQKIIINDLEYTDASAKTHLLRQEQHERYQLVLQMQNRLEQNIHTSIEIHTKQNHYVILCEYQNVIKPFILFFARGQEQILNLSKQGLMGIKFHIRNQSMNSNKQNWRMVYNTLWKGSNHYDENQVNFKGVIFEIQFTDDKMGNIKLHLKQIPRKNIFQTKEKIIERIQHLNILYYTKTQKIESPKTCENAAIQKLFQGISYEYGTLKITNGSSFIHKQPKQLLSFTPAREKFPWGFLWDDGFHCQVAVRSQPEMVIKIIQNWLDTMLENGWIPRQQNRGAQLQYYCDCPRFMPKDVKDGNPPTLLLALDYLKRTSQLNPQNFQLVYYEKLKKWYKWFLETQSQGDQLVFRWHDSINNQDTTSSFTSGMDDFPRPKKSKGHIDLQSWMYFFSKLMSQISNAYGDNAELYNSNAQKIKTNLHYFLDPKDKVYKDFTNSTHFSQHFGYPSILPIAMGMVAYDSSQYNQIISMIKDHLDDGVGLTSISRHSHSYLQNKDAYWKGPVWVNINYMFLRGLKLYYPAQSTLYSKLRNDLVKVVCGNWEKTGYFYQNYIKGRGSFGFPFNGWTSLISIIIKQNY